MSRSLNQPVSLRKQPQQARSSGLVEDVLKAAVQVLEKEGARRFTMARVAERAGVSVGSLYQYFPNKAAVLYRLQSEEWARTTGMMRDILLGEGKASPFQRLRMLVHAFIRSECEEALMRGALDDAAPLYRDAPETKAAMAEGDGIMGEFIARLLPDAPENDRATITNLISGTLTEAGKDFSESSPADEEIARYSDAMADMFRAYIMSLRRKR